MLKLNKSSKLINNLIKTTTNNCSSNSVSKLFVINSSSNSNKFFGTKQQGDKKSGSDNFDNLSIKSQIFLNYDNGSEKGGYMKKSLYDYDPIATKAIKESTEYFAFGDTKVGDIIKSKSEKQIIYIKSNNTIYDAIKTMNNHGIGCLLVVSEVDGSLVGIFTERDYLGKVALMGKSSKETYVQDAMTTKVITINSKVGVVEAMKLMTEKRFRHIPVTDEDGINVIGLVSITDLIKTLRTNQKETIKYLNNFLNDPGRYSL
ncbi:hypothetical protein RB653_002535 [Dictyostelium firmibasis]|uniref:CBS domain-containing protein n=1 Tax=Dictyostelium firmibasis TaxID=79012 RepID=A0AAN7TP07_9MYCE